jgi:hypothetical protein
MTPPLEHDAVSPNASAERLKIFGWLSLENAIQLVAMFVGMGLTFGYLSSDIRTQARDLAVATAKLEIVTTATNDLRSDVRAIALVNAQQDGAISGQQQKSEGDRKLLMELSNNMAVLLDRTDPKKVKP